MRRLLIFVTIWCLAGRESCCARRNPPRREVGLRRPPPVARRPPPRCRHPPRASRPPPIINAASVKGFQSTVSPSSPEYCFGCHGNKGEAKNGLNLPVSRGGKAPPPQQTLGKGVRGVLRRGDLPPIGENPPKRPGRGGVPAGREREVARIDRVTPPDPGRVTARRLNRNEYNNTVRDLLGVDLRPGRRLPAGRLRLRLRQHRRRAVAVAGADGEVPVGRRARRARALFGPPTLKPTLTRCDPRDGASATRARSRRLRRHRPEPAERVPRRPSRPGRRRVRDPRRASAASGRRRRSRSRVAVDRRARGADVVHDPERPRPLRSRSPGLRRPDRGVPRALTAGDRRSRWRFRGSSKACRPATAARTPRRGRPAARVQPAAERHARADRQLRKKRSRSAGRAREDPAQRRARRNASRSAARTRRPPRPVAREPARIYVCGHRNGGTSRRARGAS